MSTPQDESAREHDPRERTELLALDARAGARRGWVAAFDRDILWTQIAASTARARACAPERALEGCVVAVKDQIEVAGLPTRCGTGFYRAPGRKDAEVVRRLRGAGAIVLGKSTMHELALGPTGRNRHHGDAQNPWDPMRDTGGSSSGSAALVASGIAAIAVGTDLGGSVRIPGSLCGVASLKPTFGAVSKAGVVPVAPSLEHVGLFARDMNLLARAFVVSARQSPPVPTPRKLRIGLCDDSWVRASPDVRRVARAALEDVVASGRAEIVHMRLPDIDVVARVGAVLSSAEAARAWGWALDVPGARRGETALSPATRIALAVGRRIDDRALERATRVRKEIRAAFDACFGRVDVVATPTTMQVAEAYAPDGADGELDEDTVLGRIAATMLHNLTGTPALQVPCGFAPCGMPVGLQLAGPAWSEPMLLTIGAWIEAVTERRRPSVSEDLASTRPMPIPTVAVRAERSISVEQSVAWPLLIEAPLDASPEEKLVYLGERMRSLVDQLPTCGAVLMRGFGVSEPERLSSALATIGLTALSYLGGDSPRTSLGSKVYTSTEAPGAIKIPLHNEMSYLTTSPRYLFMACAQPADRGGETIIANGRKVLEEIDPDVRERFGRLGISYRCNLRGKLGVFAVLDRWFKVKKSWMDTFETDDEEEAERRARLVADRVAWDNSGQLVLESTVRALVEHPATGDRAWFNQAHLFHLSPRYLGNMRFTVASALYADPETRPHHATYGDGSPIDTKTLDHVHDVLDRNTVPVAWQRGDLLWLDNLVTMHGRERFQGPRRVMVALANP